jgi:hypothetical protein
MQKSREIVRASLTSLLLALMVAGSAAVAWGQHPQDQYVYGTQKKSQAEAEAERLVSLSPEQVIKTLTEEPALMLVVKKRLVKAAFDQGRLLEESDLTDDAVFRLIREDSLSRARATREIEDRNYLRPKPTNAELELQRKENLYWDSLGRDVSRPVSKETSDPAAGQPRTANSRANNQESDYWKRHEDDITNIPPRSRTAQQPNSVGEYSPDERGGTRGVGRERDLNRTEMESPADMPTDDAWRHRQHAACNSERFT